jgi:ParB/RepB/Spo0J family partition protein
MSFTNSAMFNYDDKVITISEIDTGDEACRLSLRADPDSLVDSIRSVGLINPPVLRQRKDLKYQIVCGFRRVMACKALGWHEIKARILKGSPTMIDSLKLAILDNRTQRDLNVIEQARGIEKLSAYIPSGNRLEALAPVLGFPQNQKVFKRIEALGRLPGAIQGGVTDEIVSFEAAVDLSELSHEDAPSFFELFKKLKLSQNKQREVITLAREIGAREDLRPGVVLQSREIRTILDRPDLNRNEKGSRVRSYLKQRRFPTLAKAEERFSKELKALKLNEHIHMTPPPYFEGGPHTLRMTFKSIKDFDERRKSLDAMSKNPALKRLLEPFDDK